MVAFFLIVAFVPLLLALAAFVFLDGITWKEFLCIIGAELIVGVISAGIVYFSDTHDTEVWNGRVSSKERTIVSCEHSYSCNCRTVCSGSGKNKSCSTVCDTCYEHSYDVDWRVYTTNGEELNISRVDRQGVVEPGRWTAVRIGEPTSLTHSYTNYIKASPGTLFRHQGLKEKYAGRLPTYPDDVYDYYRLNRLVPVGVSVPDAKAWDADLSELNADLGRTKEVNMVVVLVKDMPADYFYALEESWIGAKKNDVVLVVSVDAGMHPQWASVMCWTTSELFKVKLRDDVMNDKTITKDEVMKDLRTNVSSYYVRKPMKDFEYLRASIVPTQSEWTVTLIVSTIIGIGLIVFFQMHDVFGDERSMYRRRNDAPEFMKYVRERAKHHYKRIRHRVSRLLSPRPWEDA